MYFTNPSSRRYGLAFLIGILAGVFGAIVKWGWEVPFPPRDPNVFFPLGALERVTPPKIFLEQIGAATDWVYVFSGVSQPLSIFIVHVLFSVVFGVAYCMIAEAWPRIKMWQGAVFGFFIYLFAHVIVMPLIGEVPPLSEMPLDEHLSEIFGHIVWLWGMEIVRRDIRNRITGLPDPS
ncbi:DUF1440 domain-containing protein [Campylobacter sp. 19-13652]|uniref:YagU family protein n=1 Tax=Campylobacter sp. 19-13652 TaxID=2840180 RepID=UPI001C7526C9|nr:DUF1440 domain-containing protein [Campylobacter sp. 19-13652]BCX80195.1 membrane protein [Campylobacter sp. 19-13652]